MSKLLVKSQPLAIFQLHLRRLKHSIEVRESLLCYCTEGLENQVFAFLPQFWRAQCNTFQEIKKEEKSGKEDYVGGKGRAAQRWDYPIY